MKHKDPWLQLQLSENPSLSLFPFESFSGFCCLPREQPWWLLWAILRRSGWHHSTAREDLCLLFVVPCQGKAVYEKTASVCPVAMASSEDLSLGWGIQWGWKTKESCVRAPSGEHRGRWGSMMPAWNRCWADVFCQNGQSLQENSGGSGWWTGDWHSKRSSVVLAWMLCSYSTKLTTQVPLGRQPTCCQNYARWRPQSNMDYIPRNFFFSSLKPMLRKCFSLSCTESLEWEWTWLGVHSVKKE